MMELTGLKSKYVFDENTPIQQGKFSLVYRGVDELQHQIIVKRLAISSPSLTDIRRFKNEYDFRVQHPHVLAATDYIIQDGNHYLIRPWIDGIDLSKRLKKYAYQEVVQLVLPLLQALEALHQNQLVHLDIQPKNVIIDTKEKVWLTDLGLAMKQNGNATQTRQPFSILYAAPEQILNFTHLFNPSTDLYAVGMLLFELLTGAKPHQHPNPEVLMNLVLAAPLPKTNLPKPWVDFLVKATAKPRFLLPPTHYTEQELEEQFINAQQQRFTTVAEFRAAFLSLPPLKRKWWFW